MEEGRSAFKILTGTPRHRWKDNIAMNLKEIVVNMRNCIDSAHCQYSNYWRALVSAVLNF